MSGDRRSILAVFAVAIAIVRPAPAVSQNRPRTIVALVAHADDETAAGPALARYARDPILLGFPDGKLGDYLGDRGLMTRLTGRIASEIERLHPDAVVTWGPDGGTGHPDHRIVGNIATQLLRFGAAGMPERLFYMYLPVGMIRQANPPRGEPPLLFPQAKYFTVKVPVTPADLDAATEAMARHKTPFSVGAVQLCRSATYAE